MPKVTIKLNEKGLVPAIAQDARTGEVLMLAYMSKDSLERTMDSGEAWFYSRSRQELWHKGETSGNNIKVHSIAADCDGDTLLLRSEPTGPVCHTGAKTCFFRDLEKENMDFQQAQDSIHVLEELTQVIQERKATMPADSYVAGLLKEGPDRVAQKIVEEAGETAIAAVKNDREALVKETADLWFHSLMLLASRDISPNEVWEELKRRRR